MVRKLLKLLTKKDKKFLVLLFFFSIGISLIETVGISVIMPFIALATNFNLIHSNEYYKYIYEFFSFNSDVTFVVSFGTLLIFFYIFRSIINLFYFYLLNRFSHTRYHILSYRLFESYLNFSYKDFIKRNSSVLTKAIVSEAIGLTEVISAFLFMFSEVFIIIFIYSLMLYTNYKITIFITIMLAINGLLMLKTVSEKIKKTGIDRESLQKRFFEILNKSFANYKLIKLQSNDEEMLKEFNEASYDFSHVKIKNSTLNQVPRLFLEGMGFSTIVFIITYLVWKYEGDISDILPIISMFVLGLYRLLPSFNRILTSYNHILYYHKSVDIIHSDLMYDFDEIGTDEVVFNSSINIKKLSFEYDDNKPILRDITLDVKKGMSLAFIGESGSGKSTLVDILIGLYRPTNGQIFIDQIELTYSNIKSWRSKVGYIPQQVYLFDGTVGENISFGSEYNENKIIECLKKANIYDFLNTKKGVDTLVGEGGVMLSGGQKQRIAIARALYRDPAILVLDEATSALDEQTERKIMDEIYEISQDKTLIIIAHRLSTIDRCDKVYKLHEGGIINT